MGPLRPGRECGGLYNPRHVRRVSPITVTAVTPCISQFLLHFFD
jgi:hypothetical protein